MKKRKRANTNIFKERKTAMDSLNFLLSSTPKSINATSSPSNVGIDAREKRESNTMEIVSLSSPSFSYMIGAKKIVESDFFNPLLNDSSSSAVMRPVPKKGIGCNEFNSDISQKHNRTSNTFSNYNNTTITQHVDDGRPKKMRKVSSGKGSTSDITNLKNKIIAAMDLGNINILKKIVQHNPNILLQTAFGSVDDNIVHLAARCNNLIALKFVLSLLSDPLQKIRLINAKNNLHIMPIQVASAYSGVALVALLIENGASVNCKTSKQFNLLHIACIHENSNVVKFFTEKYRHLISQKYQKHNGTPIFTTFYNRNAHCFNAIIKSGFHISSITYQQKEYSLLHLCCALGNTIHLPLLIEKFRAELEGTTSYPSCLMPEDSLGRTPLDIACIKADKDFISVLLNLLPPGTVTNAHLHSAIAHASICYNTDIIPILQNEMGNLTIN